MNSILIYKVMLPKELFQLIINYLPGIHPFNLIHSCKYLMDLRPKYARSYTLNIFDAHKKDVIDELCFNCNHEGCDIDEKILVTKCGNKVCDMLEEGGVLGLITKNRHHRCIHVACYINYNKNNFTKLSEFIHDREVVYLNSNNQVWFNVATVCSVDIVCSLIYDKRSDNSGDILRNNNGDAYYYGFFYAFNTSVANNNVDLLKMLISLNPDRCAHLCNSFPGVRIGGVEVFVILNHHHMLDVDDLVEKLCLRGSVTELFYIYKSGMVNIKKMPHIYRNVLRNMNKQNQRKL